MEFVHALPIGAGLAPACGFRVFLPLPGLALAAHHGNVAPDRGSGRLTADATRVLPLSIPDVARRARGRPLSDPESSP